MLSIFHESCQSDNWTFVEGFLFIVNDCEHEFLRVYGFPLFPWQCMSARLSLLNESLIVTKKKWESNSSVAYNLWLCHNASTVILCFLNQAKHLKVWIWFFIHYFLKNLPCVHENKTSYKHLCGTCLNNTVHEANYLTVALTKESLYKSLLFYIPSEMILMISIICMCLFENMCKGTFSYSFQRTPSVWYCGYQSQWALLCLCTVSHVSSRLVHIWILSLRAGLFTLLSSFNSCYNSKDKLLHDVWFDTDI